MSIAARLIELRLNAQIGIGPNPDLAFLAARRARTRAGGAIPCPPFLADLAVNELDPVPELFAVLRDLGFTISHRFTSLSRGDLMDRLGPDAARLLGTRRRTGNLPGFGQHLIEDLLWGGTVQREVLLTVVPMTRIAYLIYSAPLISHLCDAGIQDKFISNCGRRLP